MMENTTHTRVARMFHAQMKSIFALLVLVSGPVAFADIVIQAAGLNIGDQYRLVFVTSGSRNAQSSNIADYNSFVTAQAAMSVDLVSINISWNAIGSTSTTDARDYTGTNPLALGVPIYRLDGTLVAANNASFWSGGLAAPIYLVDAFALSKHWYTRKPRRPEGWKVFPGALPR
jgi:hypothetical protein